jgi:formate hydrogenlyase subunit 3/multisubunit Na+/H+ antiporter MnhD subunit
VLLTLSIVVPLAVALALLWRRARPFAGALAPWTALPALLLSLLGEPGLTVEIDWLLLGARVGLDGTSRVFLLFTAMLWFAAGIYAQSYLAHDAHRHRFLAFFLLTMAGNLGLIVAGDMLTFYVCFAVMSFASYPLVIHAGDEAALQAGRVYIVLVIVGELLLFTGIMATAALAGRVDLAGAPAAVAASPGGTLVMTLLLVGFGIKAGALPLHVWLPLAHPAAPTPASAVLSGALIKAGFIGWLRFLPLGELSLPSLGVWCIGSGLAAAFGGAIVGVTQTDVKAALAYSSISQMGLMTVGLGVGLIAPDAWPVMLPALLLYAAHHGLAKGALFLGVGVAAAAGPVPAMRRRLVLAGLLIPALALAGLPLTSGAAAKVALKIGLDAGAAQSSGWSSPGALGLWLSLAAVGTTVLMARVLVLIARQPPPAHPLRHTGLQLPWGLLVLLSASLAWLPFAGFQQETARALAPAYLWTTLWPPLVGIAIAAVAWRRRSLLAGKHVTIPPGDLLWPALALWHFARHRASAIQFPQALQIARAGVRLMPIAPTGAPAIALRIEQNLTRWNTAGTLLLVLTAVMISLLALA